MNQTQAIKNILSGKMVRPYYAPLLVLFSLMIYTATLFPSVPGGDSGELIASACDLGVLHPPGYPLYSLLSRLFYFLPFGTPGWRVNFLSALATALASGFLFLTAARLTGSLAAALLSYALFAFSPTVWRYATMAEVFSIHNLILTTLLYSALRFYETKKIRYAYASAFVIGLGATNHQTIIFYALPLIGWAIYEIAKKSKTTLDVAKHVLTLTCISLSCMGLYAYVFYAGQKIPTVLWGDFYSIDGLIHHILRRDYGTFQLFHRGTGDTIFAYIAAYFHRTFTEMLGIGLLLAGTCFWFLKDSRHRNLILFTLGMYWFYVITFTGLSNLPLADPTVHDILSRFWQQPNILVALWASAGYLFLEDWINKVFRHASMGLAVSVLALQIGLHYAENDQHGNTVVHDYAQASLEALPQNTLLITKGDIQINAIRYMQQCEHVRLDVSIVDRSLLTYPWIIPSVHKNFPRVTLPPGIFDRAGGYLLKDLIAANIDHMSITMVDLAEEEKNQEFETPYTQSIPFGLILWIRPQGQTINLKEFYTASSKSFDSIDIHMLDRYKNEPWSRIIWFTFWGKLHDLGLTLVQRATNVGDVEGIRLGIKVWERMVKDLPDVNTSVLKNLGIAYATISNLNHENHTEKILNYWREFIRRTHPTDPDFQLITSGIASIEHGVMIQTPKPQVPKK